MTALRDSGLATLGWSLSRRLSLYYIVYQHSRHTGISFEPIICSRRSGCLLCASPWGKAHTWSSSCCYICAFDAQSFFCAFFWKHSGLAAWHFDCPKPVHTPQPLKSIVIGREGIMSLRHLRESEQLQKPKSRNNKTKLEYLPFILALYHQRCQRKHSYSLCSRWQLICGRPSWLMGLLPPLLEGSLYFYWKFWSPETDLILILSCTPNRTNDDDVNTNVAWSNTLVPDWNSSTTIGWIAVKSSTGWILQTFVLLAETFRPSDFRSLDFLMPSSSHIVHIFPQCGLLKSSELKLNCILCWVFESILAC